MGWTWSAPQMGTQKITFETNPTDLLFDLSHQANSATRGHAEGMAALTPEQEQEIVDFEMKLVTAQIYDYRAGRLDAGKATGGPAALGTSTQRKFFVGINDPLGGNPHGTTFTPKIFGLFDAWASGRRDEDKKESELSHGESRKEARASILRGQELFNSKPMAIRSVAGLNDDLGVETIPGTCGTCHDSPDVGNHSLPVPLNIGVADENSSLNVRYLPVFVLRNNATGDVKTTTDPGRALVTGLWKDVGRFKGPILRGLASRPPYFHNGSAQSLSEVLDFYEMRFGIGLTAREKADLIAFLNTL